MSNLSSNFMRCWKPCVQTAREEGSKVLEVVKSGIIPLL